MHGLARSRDLRRGRFSEEGRPYLLTLCTAQRNPVFASWKLGRVVVNEMRAVESRGYLESLAWVIMPDHLHWLIVLQKPALENTVRDFKSSTARQVNRMRETTGALWQAGFHDHAVRRDEDIQALARYIVANPLRAGLVSRVGDYPLWDAVWL
ncbi:REP-associated tyrosine transposase [Stutzerimonas stutzeri]|uniref:REP-associated tyrosine transposase n=1 Tax=Stutzerimonas stutzeri TaxID=316 RepID=UPI002657AF4C|nr:transposase [Stutzerimonas stutzeri]MCF6781769.1 transposase [Stutzerimonas stutzeri]MCF6804438.1 transposase [Stutzerimonas stutzeri]